MEQNGLAKLVEEIGELGQVCGKLIQYPILQHETDQRHPDGTDLRERLTAELADVTAAIGFVIAKMGLDHEDIAGRAVVKFRRFKAWDAGTEIE